MKRQRILLGILALCLFALPVLAQQQTGVTGTVKDADGGVLPGVQVTVKNMGTGLTRSAWSSGEGRFSVSGLPPGTYSVTAQLQGFADYELKDLKLVVGTTAPINAVLRPAGLQETVTVSAERTIIETTESDISNAISEELIQSLPVAERNAITLALLVPGVAASPYFDPTKSRDNFDGVSFGGASASENLVLVDGADNNDDVVGSILQFYPQDSIQEFEIVWTRFKAEYGHTDGGVVNMITKSGTNAFSGGGYWLFRDDSLNAKTFVEKDQGAAKGTFRQNVAGAYFGGPLAVDKAFFFGNFDYTKRPQTLTFSTGGKVPQVDAQGQAPTDFKQTLFVGKMTANLNENNFFTARYAYQDDSTVNVNLNPTDGLEHGGLGANKYHAFLLKNATVIGGDMLNEAHWQFNRFRNAIDSNAVGTALENKELFVGNSSLGHNSNHPQATDQDKHQFVNNFSWRSTAGGDHDFKAGFEWQHAKLGGQFSTGTSFASFTWDTEADFLAGAPANQVDINNGYLFFIGQSKVDIFSLYLQDDWKLSDKLTMNLGLRWDLETNDWTQKGDRDPSGFGPGRTFFSADPLFFGGQPETDGNNVGPRVGFAYDINGDASWVLRGGWGLYYQQIFWNSPIRLPFVEGPTLGNEFVDDGRLATFKYTDPFCAAGVTTGVGCIPNPSQPGANASEFVGSGAMQGVDPNIKTPFSHQFSIGFAKELSPGWGLDVDYVHNRSDNQIYRTRQAGRATVDGLNTVNFGRRGTINTGGAEQRYNGLLISMRGRIDKMTTQLSYSLGRAEGHIARQTDRLIDDSDAGFDKNFGPRTANRDHLFATSINYDLPYEIQIGTVLKFQSGFNFTGFDPSQGDLDNDGSSTDSIAGNGNRGEYKGDSFSQVDVRFAKKFTLAQKYHPQVFFEVFNLFNSRNEKPDSVDNIVGNSTFGTSAQVAGQPLNAQFSVRFDF